MSIEDPIIKLWRVRKTVFEMLQDRGYLVAEKFRNETKEEFSAMFKSIEQEGGGRERLGLRLHRRRAASAWLSRLATHAGSRHASGGQLEEVKCSTKTLPRP